MNPALAARIGELTDLGWGVRSQTESTAALETRSRFHWGVLLILLIFFLGFGAILYVGYWLLTSRQQVFLKADGNEVSIHGDVWFVESQMASLEAARRTIEEVRRRGFWATMWPSLVALALSLAVWLGIISLFVAIVR